ncbi:hypothetical protein HYC85_010233 [Camellia sinensis]|uniref:Uncharacterized protein n=1 Tax=Camellia sinensis TaxID=4442 RepID=A0A7J7HHW4_CAMSI|nr:hypothetical protein HYC85_010233 [Camellia sinensis]
MVSLIIVALVWGSLLLMLGIETRIYIREFRCDRFLRRICAAYVLFEVFLFVYIRQLDPYWGYVPIRNDPLINTEYEALLGKEHGLWNPAVRCRAFQFTGENGRGSALEPTCKHSPRDSQSLRKEKIRKRRRAPMLSPLLISLSVPKTLSRRGDGGGGANAGGFAAIADRS